MATAKVKLPEFRISLAAVGRRLSSVMLRAKSGELSREEFMDTINAVYDSCVTEEITFDPDAIIDSEILAAEQAEIEKSVRRSRAARKAAERRRLRSGGLRAVTVPAGVEEASQDISAGLRTVTDPERAAEANQDSSAGLRTVTDPERVAEANQDSSAGLRAVTDPESEEDGNEPEEIFESKYDAYGVRRRWY